MIWDVECVSSLTSIPQKLDLDNDRSRAGFNALGIIQVVKYQVFGEMSACGIKKKTGKEVNKDGFLWILNSFTAC